MTDVALALLRVWLGVVMLLHGINHGKSLDGTARWFESVGFSQSRLLAMASTGGEIAIGLGLIAGLLTSFAAAGLVATMVTAFWAIHRFAGFFVFSRPDEGWEYVATLTLAAVSIAILGPGAISVDSQLGLSDRFDGVAGLLIALGGLVVAWIQLAVLWRRPAQE